MAAGKFRIIFEDDSVVIVEKPSGILTIPAPGYEGKTLTDVVNFSLDERGIDVNAYPCHRLDRETSGVMIFAKGKSVQKIIMDQFKSRIVKKKYIAVVHGSVKKDFDTIASRIYNKNKSRSEEALTKYKVISRMGRFSVLEVEPITGRTNQIRVHMARIGHPLVGESVYSFRKDFALKFKRAALHASSVEFTHPVSGARLKFSSPLPDDIEKLINRR